MTKFFGKCDPNAPQMKLCTVPKNTKLIETTASGKPFRYPVVTVENVIVLPGIPQLFERSINNLIGYWETDRAGGAFSTTIWLMNILRLASSAQKNYGTIKICRNRETPLKAIIFHWNCI